MSGIKPQKRKTKSRKEQFSFKKKQKNSNKHQKIGEKITNTNTKGCINTGENPTSSIILNTRNLENSSENDKHSKLKNRKRFKKLKKLQRKHAGEDVNVNEGDRKDFKNTSEKRNISEKSESSDKNGVKPDKKLCNLDSVRGDSKKTITVAEMVSGTVTQTKNKSRSEKKRLKRIKWKQHQMAEKLIRKEKMGKQESNNYTEKIALPKTAAEATNNWKQLQEVLSKDKESSECRKRKIPSHRMRNPKYKKLADHQDTDRGHDAVEKNETKEPDIWFDDVDEILLERKPAVMKSEEKNIETNDNGVEENNPLVKQGGFDGLTKTVCMDCEMVGVGDGDDNMLARVSVVNQFGKPVYDKFVKPKEKVVDYRTHVSGVRAKDLENAEEFEQVQKEVSQILGGRILVGHAIKNDLKVLYLSHPIRRIRDTSLYKPFRQLCGGRTPSLKKLSEKLLGVKVQEGEHNSVQDAQATMRLYTLYRKQWEKDISLKKKERKGKKRKS